MTSIRVFCIVHNSHFMPIEGIAARVTKGVVAWCCVSRFWSRLRWNRGSTAIFFRKNLVLTILENVGEGIENFVYKTPVTQSSRLFHFFAVFLRFFEVDWKKNYWFFCYILRQTLGLVKRYLYLFVILWRLCNLHRCCFVCSNRKIVFS